jgi:alkylation response protein AidB-like acyl-CoA dehydrogenase
MDFADSLEHPAFHSEFRRWLEANLPSEICVDAGADQRVAPDRETLEKRIAWQKTMHAAGWVGISWPEEYGGPSASFKQQVIFDEEYFRTLAPILPTASSLSLLGPVRPLVLLNGHGHFNEVFFEDVVVPKENLVGPFESGLEGRDHDFDVRAQRATVALAAEMCGGAQQVLDMTVAYAKMRVAFGKPIGSYQGVKHPAADMLVALENAKSLTYYAVWAVDRGLDEFRLAVSMAKAAASDMSGKVAGTCIQLHGASA